MADKAVLGFYMSINQNQKKLFFRLFLGLITNLLLYGMAVSGDILFHEEIGREAIIYSILPDGSNLKKIGQGLSPQWSPDGKYISYVEYAERGDPTFGKALIIIEHAGKEIFRIGGIKDITNIITPSIVRYRWNPNGKGIALVTVSGRHQGAIAYYDIKTSQLKSLHKIEFRDLDMAFLTTTLEWSPDGRQILFYSGSALPKKQGIVLIDIESGTLKILSETGILPGFMGNKVFFVIGSEIWTVNLDGSDKKRLLDVGIPVSTLSKIVNNKLILQTFGRADAKKMDEKEELPFKLYLLNLDDKKKDLKEIGSKNYLLLCPNISPDGSKFTAIGLRFKKDGQIVSEGERELGYYIFDIETGDATLLKRFEDRDKGKGFWWGIYAGYGNHTSWSR